MYASFDTWLQILGSFSHQRVGFCVSYSWNCVGLWLNQQRWRSVISRLAHKRPQLRTSFTGTPLSQSLKPPLKVSCYLEVSQGKLPSWRSHMEVFQVTVRVKLAFPPSSVRLGTWVQPGSALQIWSSAWTPPRESVPPATEKSPSWTWFQSWAVMKWVLFSAMKFWGSFSGNDRKPWTACIWMIPNFKTCH